MVARHEKAQETLRPLGLSIGLALETYRRSPRSDQSPEGATRRGIAGGFTLLRTGGWRSSDVRIIRRRDLARKRVGIRKPLEPTAWPGTRGGGGARPPPRRASDR